jgi:hypothetical protein
MSLKKRDVVWISFFPLLWLLCASPAFCQDKIMLPCEVMESSEPIKSTMPKLNGVRYLLLHQANAADREALSQWLTQHGGTEVVFAFKGHQHKAILCRLANCFGRGLLIYTDDVRIGKRDIVDVFLPRSP